MSPRPPKKLDGIEEAIQKRYQSRRYAMIRQAKACVVTAVFFAILSSHFGCAKEISREKLIADVRQLSDILEKAHPDPYLRGGGKIAFHRRLQKTVRTFLHTVRENNAGRTQRGKSGLVDETGNVK